MRELKNYLLVLIMLCLFIKLAAQDNFNIRVKVTLSDAQKKSFKKGGRLLFHLTSQTDKEPRSNSEVTIGCTPKHWEVGKPFTINTKNKNFLINGAKKLIGHFNQKYYYQVVYKQNETDGNENVEGNLYSEVDSFFLTNNSTVALTLKSMIPASSVIDHPYVKTVTITSKYLSDFFGTPRQIKASILLPSGYFKNSTKNYPICYRAPGLNGRYTAINNLINRKEFANWWFSSDAPQVIYVFLDSQGPYGDTYQVDSENNGPCGKALTEELIPAIEKLVQYDPATKKRYVVGASTGGWVAMGLQIFYPDFFDGAWSYSPDPLEFEHYGLIDIYHDSTIFYNKYGYLQPGRRTTNGEPTLSMKDWIHNENTNSSTNDYRVSGGQFGAYNAVFGPKATD